MMKNFLLIAGGLALAGIIGLFVVCAGIIGSAQKQHAAIEASKTPEQKAAEAAAKKLNSEIAAGRDHIEQLFKRQLSAILKSPKTAQFEIDSSIVKNELGKAGVVRGTVTAQNSFGALLTQKCSGIYLFENGETLAVSYQLDKEFNTIDEAKEKLAMEIIKAGQGK